ncbi:hypothetical protein SESBI_21971 [Sesbania bispinosa]|nr:hypothetical protein SESBI_21971 [Sesbania bispinosa]
MGVEKRVSTRQQWKKVSSGNNKRGHEMVTKENVGWWSNGKQWKVLSSNSRGSRGGNQGY